MHLTLLSLFETIFFWNFVSKTEDAALINLVNSYSTGILSRCAALTPQQRAIIRDVFDLLINQTSVDAYGSIASTARTAFNDSLFRKSWFYFGGILTVFTAVAASGFRKIKGRVIVGENIVLILLLGFYEWMFFSTIVLRYQAISMPELDRMIVDEVQTQC